MLFLLHYDHLNLLKILMFYEVINKIILHIQVVLTYILLIFLHFLIKVNFI